MATIEDVLYKISPDCDYKTWFNIISCVKSNVGESGFDLVNNWSSQSTKYKGESDLRKIFNSANDGFSGYGILINVLKEQNIPVSRLNIEDSTNRKLLKRKLIDTKTPEIIWNQSESIDNKFQHPYLFKKNIEPNGSRVNGGRLIIPVNNMMGTLCSVQQIFLNDAGKFVKLFVKNTRVKNHFYCLEGDPSSVFVCEGFATGVSLQEIYGNTVYIAFSKNNIINVVNQLIPFSSSIIVAGDNDSDPDYFHRTFNPLEIEVILPNEKYGDFNDQVNNIEK